MLNIAVAALLPGTLWVIPARPLKDPLVALPRSAKRLLAGRSHGKREENPAQRVRARKGMGLDLTLTGLRKVAPWPYRTSASGLHSKMLLVNGLKCSQGKSANFSRNLGTCVGSRGPPNCFAKGEGLRREAEAAAEHSLSGFPLPGWGRLIKPPSRRSPRLRCREVAL